MDSPLAGDSGSLRSLGVLPGAGSEVQAHHPAEYEEQAQVPPRGENLPEGDDIDRGDTRDADAHPSGVARADREVAVEAHVEEDAGEGREYEG